jgi:glycerol dehydrogenase
MSAFRIISATPRYVQGPGAIALLPEQARQIGKNPVLICDGLLAGTVGARARDAFPGAAAPLVHFTGEVTRPAIEGLAAEFARLKGDVVVGIGGGKTLDAAKGVAWTHEAPFISVPTIASTDAPASAGIAVYNDSHVMTEVLQLKRNPDCVLVDTAIIAAAPIRYLRAGIGDAIAKKFEAEACARAGGLTKHRTHPSATGLLIADACFQTIRRHGVSGLAEVEGKAPGDAYESLVEAVVLLSALGFENGGLSISHAVTRGLMQVRTIKDALHGYHVAYGLLVQLVLEGRDADFLGDITRLLRSVGLPTKLSDMGLDDLRDFDLALIGNGTMSSINIRNFERAVEPADIIAAVRYVESL